MNKVSAFKSLIDVARNGADKASRQLGRLISEHHDAQAQLSMLRDYRHDYARRLQHATHTGLPASSYQNFRQFITTLDEAISQQGHALARLDSRVHESRAHWQREQRRLNAFETLETRAAIHLRQRQHRQEQTVSDETSADIYRRTRHT